MSDIKIGVGIHAPRPTSEPEPSDVPAVEPTGEPDADPAPVEPSEVPAE